MQKLQWRHSTLVTSEVRMINNEVIQVVADLLVLIFSLFSYSLFSSQLQVKSRTLLHFRHAGVDKTTPLGFSPYFTEMTFKVLL